jgi:hypothetical protein
VTTFLTIPENFFLSLLASSEFSQQNDEAGGSYRWTQEFSADIRPAEKSSKYVFRFSTDSSQAACVYDSVSQRFDVKRRVRVNFFCLPGRVYLLTCVKADLYLFASYRYLFLFFSFFELYRCATRQLTTTYVFGPVIWTWIYVWINPQPCFLPGTNQSIGIRKTSSLTRTNE